MERVGPGAAVMGDEAGPPRPSDSTLGRKERKKPSKQESNMAR